MFGFCLFRKKKNAVRRNEFANIIIIYRNFEKKKNTKIWRYNIIVSKFRVERRRCVAPGHSLFPFGKKESDLGRDATVSCGYAIARSILGRRSMQMDGGLGYRPRTSRVRKVVYSSTLTKKKKMFVLIEDKINTQRVSNYVRFLLQIITSVPDLTSSQILCRIPFVSSVLCVSDLLFYPFFSLVLVLAVQLQIPLYFALFILIRWIQTHLKHNFKKPSSY